MKYDMPLFKKDIQLLIDNAKTYNVEGSIVVQDAVRPCCLAACPRSAWHLANLRQLARLQEALGEVFKAKSAAAAATWQKDEAAADKAAEAVR